MLRSMMMLRRCGDRRSSSSPSSLLILPLSILLRSSLSSSSSSSSSCTRYIDQSRCISTSSHYRSSPSSSASTASVRLGTRVPEAKIVKDDRRRKVTKPRTSILNDSAASSDDAVSIANHVYDDYDNINHVDDVAASFDTDSDPLSSSFSSSSSLSIIAPSCTVPSFVRDNRVRVSAPWYAQSSRVSWEFASFASANDFGRAFDHIESVARASLAKSEDREREKRAVLVAEAAERGEVLPPLESELHPSLLSNKARRRLRDTLTSSSTSLRILSSLPRSRFAELFTSFASYGQIDGMDYIARRMEQAGWKLDSGMAEVWVGGMIVEASSRRVKDAREILEQQEQKEAKAQSEARNAIDATSASTTLASSSLARTQSSSSALTSHGAPCTLGVGHLCSGITRTHLESVLLTLERGGVPYSFKLVRMVFECLAIDNDLHGALGFVSRLYKPSSHYKVSGATYALLIQALAKHQDSKGCMYVYLHMERSRFAPDANTFNALIQSFALVGDYRTAYKLMTDMKLAKLTPDNNTFASIIAACARAGKMDLAVEMFEYLKKHHMVLTTSRGVYTPNVIAAGQSSLSSPSSSSSSPSSSSSSPSINSSSSSSQSQSQSQSPSKTTTGPLLLGPAPFGVLISEYIKLNELKKAVVRERVNENDDEMR